MADEDAEDIVQSRAIRFDWCVGGKVVFEIAGRDEWVFEIEEGAGQDEDVRFGFFGLVEQLNFWYAPQAQTLQIGQSGYLLVKQLNDVWMMPASHAELQ